MLKSASFFFFAMAVSAATDSCGGDAPEPTVSFSAVDHDDIQLPQKGWSDLEARWSQAAFATLASDADARERFAEALALVQQWADEDITTERIVALHSVLMGQPSALRRAGEQVGAGGENTVYAPGGQVAELMAQLDTTDPALLDRQLLTIHPFADGNGRIARLVSTWAQLQA